MDRKQLTQVIDGLGRAATIDALFRACSRLWQCWVNPGDGSIWSHGGRTVTDLRVLECAVFPEPGPFREHLIGCLSEAGLLDTSQELSRRVFDPATFVRAFVDEWVRDDDLKYFVRASIRAGVDWSSELNRCFFHLGRVSEDTIARYPRRTLPFESFRQALLDENLRDIPPARYARYVELFIDINRELRMLLPVQTPVGTVRVAPDRIDCEYLISNLFAVSTGVEGLDQLFGGSGIILPGVVSRSNDEDGESRSQSLEQDDCLMGRIILVRGRFGTGKSLLACHLAASVARKGGIANLTSVEQGATEYLYMLSSMGLRPRQSGYEIGFDPRRRARLLAACPADGSGALVFFRGSPDKIGDVLKDLKACARAMQRYPLRLLVLDSLNSLADPGQEQSAQGLRNELHGALREINALGVNIVLLEEERDQSAKPFMAEENLADTVIELSARSELGYLKRYIQIIKSRFQREQRGEHRLSVLSGEGIRVVPSPVAVRARVAQRRARVSHVTEEGTFGNELLDLIVGTKPRVGDVIVIEGKSGTAKSAIAERFLSKKHGRGTSLNLSIGEPLSRSHRLAGGEQRREVQYEFVPRGHASPGLIFQHLERVFNRWFQKGPQIDRLVIDDVASFDLDAPFVASDESFGHTLADYVRRQRVATVFVVRKSEWGEPDKVRRALISNADIHLRLVRLSGEHEGRALLSVVKSPGMVHRPGWFEVQVTADGVEIDKSPTLVAVNDKDEETPLRVSLFMHADTPLQAEYNYAIAGSLRATPGVVLDLVPQERVCGPHAVQLRSLPSNQELRIIQLDEFQLAQVERVKNRPDLYAFDDMAIAPEKKDFIPGVWARTAVPQAERTVIASKFPRGSVRPALASRTNERRAVPFYCNIGFLVYRQSLGRLIEALAKRRLAGKRKRQQQHGRRFDERRERDWSKLAKICSAPDLGHQLDWQLLATLSEEFEYHRDQKEFVASLAEHGIDEKQPCLFEYPGWSDENYNVLFLEILLWLTSVRSLSKSVAREPNRWVLEEPAVRAGVLFWRLCRPAFLRRSEEVPRPDNFAKHWVAAKDTDVLDWYSIRTVQNNAMIWRHWFSSLNQLTLSMSRSQLRQLNVVALPGHTAVAGDWYMAVLSNSALPETGLDVINTLSTPSAELDRLRRGIGLPSRKSFYRDEQRRTQKDESAALSVLPQLAFHVPKSKVMEMLDKSFRRSEIPEYASKAAALSSGLRRILEYDSEGAAVVDDEEVASYVRSTLSGVAEQMAFVSRTYAGSR